MRIDIMTLFPQMCEAVMSESIIQTISVLSSGFMYFESFFTTFILERQEMHSAPGL